MKVSALRISIIVRLKADTTLLHSSILLLTEKKHPKGCFFMI